MTTIRRPTGDPRRRSQRRSPLLSCRNVFLCLILLQVLSVLFSSLRAPDANPHDGSAAAPPKQQQYHGIDYVLNEFEMGKHRLVAETEKRLGIMKPNMAFQDPLGVDSDADGDDQTGQDGKPRDGEPLGRKDDDTTADRGGVTDGGYVVDFLYQRNNPLFRTKGFTSQLELDTKAVEQLAQEASLKSCLYYSDEQHGLEGTSRVLFHSSCLEGNDPLVAYNSQPFPRTLCGKTIAPKTIERFSEPCKEPVRLFPVDDPPTSGTGMPPIVIRSSSDSQGALEDVPCDTPCKQEQNMKGSARVIEGTPWKLTFTPDDPSFNSNAVMDRTAYRKDQYYSTTSFKSSVPQSLFSFDDYDLASSSAVDFDQAENLASYIVSDKCRSQTSRRQKWLDGVKEHFSVASFGTCDHNTDTDLNVKDRDDRIKLMKKYRFNLAFEAGTEKDHITGIVWEALQAGTVPVAVGAQNILDHVPSNSVIISNFFPDYESLGKYVKKVAENKTLWESYHAWRNDRKELADFEARYEFTRTSPTCRVCRWAYAKKYGLGWNHTRQVIQNNVIPRALCIDSGKYQVLRPFREAWISGHAEESANDIEGCDDSAPRESQIQVGGFAVHRGIVSHDGVVDINIDSVDKKSSPSGDLVLRLETRVKNIDGGHFPNAHSSMSTVHGPGSTSIIIQDDRSRITVLANWETHITSPKQGLVEILVHKSNAESMEEDETRRIRVIVEDVDTLNHKMTEFFPSSFLNLMVSDFVDPLLLFTTTSR